MAVDLGWRMPRRKRGGSEFQTISARSSLAEEVEKLVETLSYWPTTTDFVGEAIVEKLERHRKEAEKTSSDRFG
jgi:hypothetical protein